MSAQVTPLFTPKPADPHINKEADHRIANSLAMIGSLVRLRATKRDASDSSAFLIEIANRIDTVAKLHRLLAKSPCEAILLDEYLNEICNLTASVAEPKPLISVTCSTGLTLPAAIVMPVGLITAELLANSLKYAHPTGLPVKIGLACHRNAAGSIVFAYEDDGVGFPDDFEPCNSGQMGIKLIEALTRQVDATSEWSSDSLGIRFEMAVPAPANES